MAFKAQIDNIKIDSSILSDREIQRFVEEQTLLTLGENQANAKHGKNAEGRTMRGYSEWYKEIRKAAGKQTSRVDLEFTGQMWRSYQMRSRRNLEAEGFFSGGRSDSETNAGIAAKHHTDRGPIIGFNDKRQAKILRAYSNLIAKKIKQLVNVEKGGL